MNEWTPKKGVCWTCEIIFSNLLRDSAGTVHEPFGAMTWWATHYAHVCFDSHPFIGNKIHLMPMAQLRQAIYALSRRHEPCYGGANKTGAGFLLSVPDDGIPLTKRYTGKSMSILAVNAVEDYLTSLGRPFRSATISEQKRGIDIVLLDNSGETIEVKSRDGWYDHLFIQISETNPERRVV